MVTFADHLYPHPLALKKYGKTALGLGRKTILFYTSDLDAISLPSTR